ncbi:hypothetical protein M404DRAFT_170179 [Pisolithus tinctorius Marx 270]|uniref:Uncharacterized protein n=1 Tax=Pisolithus tinctorius Marx 270 TaxID=870435 RepID=A0A0C3J805_PISTI|nr:hypothetical protein M404DRAFT_170179 [Pisolithus tinctorius Marx 270]
MHDHTDHRRQKPFRNGGFSDSQPLPACTVCLRCHCHLVIECRATCTWDKKHKAYAERLHKALLPREDGCHICTKWQQEEGCAE